MRFRYLALSFILIFVVYYGMFIFGYLAFNSVNPSLAIPAGNLAIFSVMAGLIVGYFVRMLGEWMWW